MCVVCVCVRERGRERESLEWVLCCLDERERESLEWVLCCLDERERGSLEWVLCCLDDACVQCQQPVKMLHLMSVLYEGDVCLREGERERKP